MQEIKEIKFCYSGPGLNNRPFDEQTKNYDLNTKLVWYSQVISWILCWKNWSIIFNVTTLHWNMEKQWDWIFYRLLFHYKFFFCACKNFSLGQSTESRGFWARRPNLDGWINKNRTAEFNHTAKYWLAVFPTYYIIANKFTQYYTTC